MNPEENKINTPSQKKSIFFYTFIIVCAVIIILSFSLVASYATRGNASLFMSLFGLLFAIMALVSFFILIPIGVIYLIIGTNTSDDKKQQKYMHRAKLFTIGGCVSFPIIILLYFILSLVFNLLGLRREVPLTPPSGQQLTLPTQ